MRDTIYSAIRHALTALAGLGGFLFAHGLAAQTDVAPLNAAGVSLADALAAVATALAMRAMLYLVSKLTSKPAEGSGSPFAALGLLGAAAGLLCGALPSCTDAQLAAAGKIPIKSCVVTSYGTACYDTQSGLEVSVDTRSGK